MRALLLPVMLAALSACGEARVAAGAAQADAPARALGHFKANSQTARMLAGDVGIERGGLIFARGAVLYTRTLAPRRGGDLIARDGDSYAAAALGAADMLVELRRVTQETGEGARLCGEAGVAYVALVHEARAAAVTMLMFAGDEPPGPEATQSRLCGTFGFAAPSGARTREGVVLR